jgi:hypothetical protein
VYALGWIFFEIEIDESPVRQVPVKVISVPIEGRLAGLGIEGVRAPRLGEPVPYLRTLN